jgi:hypothetical protein
VVPSQGGLVGFQKVRLAAGAREEIRLEIPRQRLRWWDPATGDWAHVSGEVALSVTGTFGTRRVGVVV